MKRPYAVFMMILMRSKFIKQHEKLRFDTHEENLWNVLVKITDINYLSS